MVVGMLQHTFTLLTFGIFTMATTATVPAETAEDILELRFDVKFPRPNRECAFATTATRRCSLPYYLKLIKLEPSVQTGKAGSEINLDGKLTRWDNVFLKQRSHAVERGLSHRMFKEDTIVKLPAEALKLEQDERAKLEIQLFNVPTFVQNDHIIDVTKLLKAETNYIETSSNNSAAYQFSASVSRRRSLSKGTLSTVTNKRSMCACAKNECGCCAHLNVPLIYLNHTGCIKITYLPQDYGLSLTFSLDGVVWYNDTVSARNPPPMCFSVPYLREYASLCLRFHDLSLTDKVFRGCVRIEAELYHVRIAEEELGCFSMPILRAKGS